MQSHEIELCSSIAYSMLWKPESRNTGEGGQRLLNVASNTEFELYLMKRVFITMK